jgi:hypothetical protein
VRAQAERAARLDLAGWHHLHARTHDLRGVGAEIDYHRQQRRLLGRQAQSERRQAEIDQQQLDQEWRVADRLDIDLDEAAQQPPGRVPGQRAQDADREAEHHGERRQPHREPRAEQQLVEILPDDAELEDVTKGQRSHDS